MPHPFLPKLKSNTAASGQTTLALVLPHANGVWNDLPDNSRLRQIAEALDIPSRVTKVHSIPDPWARPILFQRALFDQTHVLHDLVQGEWRGLLAILALSEVRNLQGLTPEHVNLRQDGEQSAFRKVITRLLPLGGGLVDGCDWNDLHILRWAKHRQAPRAFAFTSPWTLVVTGADYNDVLDSEEIPWVQNGILTDPCSHLSSNVRFRFAEWLLHVKSNLATARADIRDIGNCLDAFAKDLDPRAQRLTPSADIFSARGLTLNSNALYAVIDKPLQPAATVASDCAIYSDRSSKKLHILIDASLAKQLHRAEQEVTVHGTVAMDSVKSWLMARGGDGALHGDLPALNGHAGHWYSPEFFFENRLIYEEVVAAANAASEVSDAFPGCRAIRTLGVRTAGRFAAVPLRAEVLEFLSPDYIQNNLTIEWLPSGVCKVVLTLQLHTVDLNGVVTGPATAVVVQHTYQPADMMRIDYLPSVCVWPNFRFADTVRDSDRDNRWKRYYLFEGWQRIGDGPSKLHVSALDDSDKPIEIVPNAQATSMNSTKCFMTVLPSFPEALRCTVESAGQPGPMWAQESAAGLLLLKAPPEIGALPAKSATLGVDFGTTGTTIYSAVGVGEPKRMSFGDRVLCVIGANSEIIQNATRDLFVPLEGPPRGQILSVFQDFNIAGQRMALRNGHVLYLHSHGADAGMRSIPGFVSGDQQHVRTNLKWSTDAQVNLAAQDFLIQLCMQSLAELAPEGVQDIELCYSYPTAFSGDDLGRLKALWNVVQRRLMDVTSIAVRLRPNPETNCESIAAARYFASGVDGKNLVIGRGAISLDVGGGTTDIAIWNRDEQSQHAALVAHLSVKFAGQDIFLDPIRRNPGVLLTISNNDPTIASAVRFTNDYERGGSAYNAEIDAIISHFGKKAVESIPTQSAETDVRALLDIIRLGLNGIAFYTGLQLGKLINEERYVITTSELPVFIGGNGARLFSWCDDASSEDHFQKSLLAGLEFATKALPEQLRVTTTISGRFKEEVAFGLVVPPTLLERGGLEVEPVSGEAFFTGFGKNSQKQNWDAAPDISGRNDLVISADSDLPVFRHFLETVDVAISEEELNEVAACADRELEIMCGNAAAAVGRAGGKAARDAVRKQPLFILALCGLVNLKTRNLERLAAAKTGEAQ